MRRAAVLAVILVMALSGVAQAAAPVAKVTGTFTYFPGGNPANFRTFSISAHATDPVTGTWSWTRPNGTYSGPVTCLHIVGPDAWMAGPATVTDGLFEAVFIWVHDGGTPGTAGDTAFGWANNPGETLATMEDLCNSMTPPPFYDMDPFPVMSGNLVVHPAR